MFTVILQVLIEAATQRFMLTFPLSDGLLLRGFPAIVVNYSALLKFEARDV
ncbi:hypothetical protein ACQK5W_15955 [Pantoea sp. FN060301]|uniref:hypothetical protein n=1 Tax=Pantoea sp. FN060301 TaxID=3420380 RepID=UPI003D168EB5